MKKRLIHIPFYDRYTETGYVPEVYGQLFFKRDNRLLYQSPGNKSTPEDLDRAYSISLFPSYLDAKPLLETQKMFFKTIAQRKIKGFAIEITEPTDFDTFYRENYSKSFRQNIKRYVNRLESCFNVKYLIFHGNISKSDYELHMQSLKRMLKYRFEEKGEDNRVLKEWDNYYNATFDLINQKKCSLFVIQADGETIHVCINRHQKNILNISIPSYDIAYSKFSLGNISIFKLLQWSIENKYDFIDMEYGVNEYKRRWSNVIYSFDHHIFYPSKRFSGYLLGRLKILKLRVINLLKGMMVDEWVEKVKRRRIGGQMKTYSSNYRHETTDVLNFESLKEISFKQLDSTVLKRTILDIAFQRKLVLSRCKIFSDVKNPNLYYLADDSTKIKIEY
ncbi:GNAT family N-acetyltransferase [Flagellimonas sp.]|uniref:GNAT family N-acetyltransferase n=1 Tax=Flagellimonas sp. TaxID=2058762 RepID=UPI003F4A5A2D